MAATVWPADAVAGAPSYSGRMYRQVHGAALTGATSSRPLGARSGIRPGTSASLVTATSTTWTVGPHVGIADVQAAAEAGTYWYSFDANQTGSVTAAGATPRTDGLWVQVNDKAEDGINVTPSVAIVYVAGTSNVGGTLVVPAGSIPARSFRLVNINVPASGGGSPTVTPVWPYAVAAGAAIPVRSDAERDAVLAALGATDEAPCIVRHVGSSNPKKGITETTHNTTPTWIQTGATAWTTLTLDGGVSVGSGQPTLAWRLEAGGVRIRGTGLAYPSPLASASAGVGQGIATGVNALPTAARPTSTRFAPVVITTTAPVGYLGELLLDSSGYLTWRPWTSLSSVGGLAFPDVVWQLS